jgi:hypothetical protein
MHLKKLLQAAAAVQRQHRHGSSSGMIKEMYHAKQ